MTMEQLEEMLDQRDFLREQLAYRVPRQISQYFIDHDGYSHFQCPSCGEHLERDYQSFCSGCGQALDWHGIHFDRNPDRLVDLGLRPRPR